MKVAKSDLLDVGLRKWRQGDEKSLVKQANNKAIARFLKDSFPTPYTYTDALRWVSFANRNVNVYQLAITLDDEVIGCVGIEKKQDIYRKSAELGYWLGEAYWSRGIMTKVVNEMIDLAFAKFNIVRLVAYVFSQNKASAKVLEKAGFKLESIQKMAIYKNGEFMDQLVYTIVRP